MHDCIPAYYFSPKFLVNIKRIDRRLYQKMVNCSGFFGRVVQIYSKGFDLITKDGGLVYFRQGKFLSTPFEVILDLPIEKLHTYVSLKEGDIFYRREDFLLQRTENGCAIMLKPRRIIDLKRTLCFSPPGFEILLRSIQLLIRQILKCGKFNGMAGNLVLFKKELPDIFLEYKIYTSSWSRLTLSSVGKLKKCVINGDLEVFEEVWETLVGLGPRANSSKR